MMRRAVVLIFGCIFSMTLCCGQEVEHFEFHTNDLKIDSVPVSLNKFKEFGLSSFKTKDFVFERESEMMMQGENYRLHFDSVYSNGNEAAPGTAVIPTWKNGAFMASGSISSYPGLMDIHKGSVGLIQNFGNLTIYAGGEANKYGYFNGLHTQYGINGTIQYNFSPRLALIGYATYYFGKKPLMANGMPMPPAMMGYYSVSKFGATVDYQLNETFGLIVGGEAVQQFGTNRYRFEPIVTPTVKIGKVRIGLPVGQIVNDMIRSHIEERRNRRVPHH
ncbi:MAG: hypothetical protein K2H46_10245 [Muribaculaceae bacterium]|nr:hypothetical protein [Muribaculaceae bacterium]